jgi:hypothetical protein
LPNGIELRVHTYFLEKVWVKLLGVGEDSVLDESVGLSLVITPQVDEGGVDDVQFIGLWCG